MDPKNHNRIYEVTKYQGKMKNIGKITEHYKINKSKELEKLQDIMEECFQLNEFIIGKQVKPTQLNDDRLKEIERKTQTGIVQLMESMLERCRSVMTLDLQEGHNESRKDMCLKKEMSLG